MVCKSTCKVLCIIGYLLSAIAAIVCGYNHIVSNPEKKIPIPKPVSILYLVGGSITLVCAIRWMMNKE